MERDGKLQKLRKAMGYTQEQFSHVLGVPRTQIAMYESGSRIPSAKFCLKLKETFNLSYEWLGEWVCEVAKQKDASKQD